MKNPKKINLKRASAVAQELGLTYSQLYERAKSALIPKRKGDGISTYKGQIYFTPAEIEKIKAVEVTPKPRQRKEKKQARPYNYKFQ
jgi:hypothetical protein